MRKYKATKRILSMFMCITLMCVFSINVFAEEQKPEPLPLEPDTTLGDVQEHFTPEVYEEMPEDLKEECDKTLMTDVMKKSVSSEKIFGRIAIVSIIFLTIACATGTSKKK